MLLVISQKNKNLTNYNKRVNTADWLYASLKMACNPLMLMTSKVWYSRTVKKIFFTLSNDGNIIYTCSTRFKRRGKNVFMQVLLELCNIKRSTYFKIQKHEIIYSLTALAMRWRQLVVMDFHHTWHLTVDIYHINIYWHITIFTYQNEIEEKSTWVPFHKAVRAPIRPYPAVLWIQNQPSPKCIASSP